MMNDGQGRHVRGPEEGPGKARDGGSAAPQEGPRTGVRGGRSSSRIARRRRQLDVLYYILLVLVIIFAWATLGLMMRIGFIPVFNLGYSWFDTHVFYFFGITAQ